MSDNSSSRNRVPPEKSARADAAKRAGSAARPAGGGGQARKRSVVPLVFKDNDALQRSYMSFVKGGGLFLPTTVSYDLNEEIFLLITLPGSQKSLPIPGVVVWVNPSTSADGRRQGIGIELKGNEGNSVRIAIEKILGSRLGSAEPTYTM